MKISVIVPVYNGEETLEKLHKALLSFFDTYTTDFELIYVYDCGRDDSLAVLKKIQLTAGTNTHIVELTRNFGQHNAIIAGIDYATGDLCITMDEDLQHLPQDIEKLIEKQQEGDYDVVYGIYATKNQNFIRNLASSFFRKLLVKAIPELYTDYSPFRLIKASIAKQTVHMNNSYTFIDGYLSWITRSFASVPVNHEKRIAGKSSYNLKKLIKHSTNILVTFSNFPIKILRFLSVTIFIITILYSSMVLIRKFVYDDLLPGYPSLIISIGFGFSFAFMGMGILGEYIYRISLKTTKKPNFLVRKQSK